MTEFNDKKATTGQQVLKAAPPGTQIHLYSDLASDPRPAHKIIETLGRNNIILYQDPSNMKTGHWVALSIHPETLEIFFFSSYGGKPDVEKMQWVSRKRLIESGQVRNVLNDGLKFFARHGWTIHYNDRPFQVVGDNTATCGVWSVAFLQSGLNPDEFACTKKTGEDFYYEYF